MSEQASGTHGPVRDEAIKRQDQAEAREYTEQWPEPGDETGQETIWAPAARLADSPMPENWQAVELRSDLARHLNRTVWPLTRDRLLEILTSSGAGDKLLELAATLPPGHHYPSLHELTQALNLDPDCN